MAKTLEQKIEDAKKTLVKLQVKQREELKREREMNDKKRTRRLIHMGILAEMYFFADGIELTDFDNLLKDIVRFAGMESITGKYQTPKGKERKLSKITNEESAKNVLEKYYASKKIRNGNSDDKMQEKVITENIRVPLENVKNDMQPVIKGNIKFIGNDTVVYINGIEYSTVSVSKKHGAILIDKQGTKKSIEYSEFEKQLRLDARNAKCFEADIKAPVGKETKGAPAPMGEAVPVSTSKP
jgi:hypothetical protein